MEEDRSLNCGNCGSSFRLMYDSEEISYSPDNCPFCGDLVFPDAEELDFTKEGPDESDLQEDWYDEPAQE